MLQNIAFNIPLQSILNGRSSGEEDLQKLSPARCEECSSADSRLSGSLLLDPWKLKLCMQCIATRCLVILQTGLSIWIKHWLSGAPSVPIVLSNRVMMQAVLRVPLVQETGSFIHQNLAAL